MALSAEQEKRLRYMAIIQSCGYIPNWKATTKALEEAVLSLIVETSPGIEMDPEIPDTYLSQLLIMLYARKKLLGTSPDEVKSILINIREVQKEATRNEGILMSLAGADKEGFFNNVGDIGSNLLGGNIGGAFNEVGDLFGDLFNI